MKRLLLWLLWAQPLRACPFDFHLWLELRPTPEASQCFRLEVDQIFGSAAHYRMECPGAPDREGEMSAEESRSFWRDLESAGAWQLSDNDEGGAESCVYYTRFDLSRGDSHQVSRWRGLGKAAGRVAQVMLEQPWSRGLADGLDWVQSQKAVTTPGKPDHGNHL